MQCGFAAAGVGHRPENSDKETTSLETPSLPTPDGFKRPVRYPEIGPKTNNPRSRILDRSISAPSVCSRGSSQAETVNRRAVNSEDSLPECSVTLESGGLPLPVFSDPVASANVRAAPAGKNGTESSCSPTVPSQIASEKPAACFGLQKPNSPEELLSLEPPIEGGGQTKELVGPFLLEHAEGDPVHELPLDLKACEKPGKELFQKEENEPKAKECLSPKDASPLHINAEPSLGDALSEGRGGTEEGETGLSSQEERRPEHAAYPCRGSETSMEVDAAEEFLVASSDPSDKPNVSSMDTDSQCSIMEVELSKRDSPVSDLMPSGRTGFESAAVSLSVASASGAQLSDQVEDPCLSLISALKELHQLLVVSSKQDMAISPQEDSLPLAAVPELQAAENEVSPEERECNTHPDSQDAGLSFPEHVSVEALAGTQTFAAGVESIDVREIHRSVESCERESLIVQESSAFLRSSTTLEQLWSGECCTSSSQRVSSDQVPAHGASEESQPPPYSFSDPQDAPQSTQHSLPEETGAPGIPCAALQSPPDTAAELLPSPPVASPSPGAPRLPVFPAADIDQLVGAGFTAQEAREALEHAGGNADLALLILLAKNIVVPT